MLECHGSGARPGTSPRICPECNGRGVVSESQGLFALSQPCPRCRGNRTVIEDPCPKCNGSGRERRTKRYTVKIPAGAKDGTRIRLKGKGEAGYGGAAGDLYVVTHIDPSPIYERRGNDLLVTVPLSFPDAALGATVEVPTPDGAVSLKVPAGSEDGKLLRIRGRGGAALRRRQGRRARASSSRCRSVSTSSSASCSRNCARSRSAPPGRIPRASGGCKAARCPRLSRARTCQYERSLRPCIACFSLARDAGMRPEGVLMDDRPRFTHDQRRRRARRDAPRALRIYEQKGLVRPRRTAGNTRLYSDADVERLQLIQKLTSDLGLNLAGVELVLRLEDELKEAHAPRRPAGAAARRGAASAQPVPPRPRALRGRRAGTEIGGLQQADPEEPGGRRSCARLARQMEAA